MMMITIRRWIAATALVIVGCQDLDIANTNAPDRSRALTQPSDVETLIASSWRNFWTRWHNGTSAYNVMPLIADVMSGTYANDAALELSSEPRVTFNNNSLSDAHTVANANWNTFYTAISSANDGLIAINGGLRIETGSPVTDNTTRAWAFAKWSQGMGYGHLSMLFDKGLYGDERSDLANPRGLPIITSAAMRDSAVKLMLQARDTMNRATFTLPDTWINGIALTSANMARLTNSYIARFYVYGARTPTERRNLPWASILNDYLNNSITADHAVTLASGLITSGFLSRMQQTGTFSAWADYKLIGPADISGNYQTWLGRPLAERTRVTITTPDRRIQGPQDQATCAAAASLPATSLCHGLYFRFRPDNIFRPERGLYHQSHYQWFRNAGRSNTGTYALVSVDEMNLLKAEAYFFTGDLTRAAELINTTRTRTVRIGTTDYPGLPAVTAAGVPQSSSCVPRKADGACGSLYDALMYERMIEVSMLDALIGYLDSRGFGRLPPGTFLELPIPARELEVLQLPIYTFGGVGGQSTAQ